LKGKSLSLLTLTLFVLFVLSLTVLAKAQTQSNAIIWSDNMKYSSIDQMESAGWTVSYPAGANFTSTGVVIVSTSITYSPIFQSNLSDWQVEDQGCWVSGLHGENNVGANTEDGSYEFAADGWYSEFILYVNSQIVWRSTQGAFTESQNTLLNLTMIKFGDKIECSYNGELKYTYSTQDSSQLVSVSAVYPWEGSTEYDYFEVSSVAGFGSSGSGSSTILSNPVAVGGIAGGVAVGVGAGVGLAVHFGVIGGSAAGSASVGSGAAATGAAGSGTGSAGSGGAGSGEGGSGGGGSSNSNLIAQASNEEPPGNILQDLPQMQQGNPLGQNQGLVQGIGNAINSNAPSQPLTSQTQQLLNQAPNNQMQQATTPAQMQQATADQNNAQNIVNQMNQANQNAQNQSIQTQDTQTKIQQIQQDVTSNKAKAQQKNAESMDQYIRASTDSDSAVAEDSGSSGTG
jgi:hypothetical protein